MPRFSPSEDGNANSGEMFSLEEVNALHPMYIAFMREVAAHMTCEVTQLSQEEFRVWFLELPEDIQRSVADDFRAGYDTVVAAAEKEVAETVWKHRTKFLRELMRIEPRGEG